MPNLRVILPLLLVPGFVIQLVQAQFLFGSPTCRDCERCNLLGTRMRLTGTGFCQESCVWFGCRRLPTGLAAQGWECGTCDEIETQPPSNPPSPMPTVVPTDLPSPLPSSLPSYVPTTKPTGSSPAPSGSPTIDPRTIYNIAMDIGFIPTAYQYAFVQASERWMEIIQGDLNDFNGNDAPSSACSLGFVPGTIDDIYICAAATSLDGVGGIIGTVQLNSFQLAGDNFVFSVIDGEMIYDSADLDNLVTDGIWEALVLRDMGQVIGLGELWSFIGLVNDDEAPCSYSASSLASTTYQGLSGCESTTSVPVAQTGDRACALWDETCLTNELMTATISSSSPQDYYILSNITLASLEDLGLQVDYSAVDETDLILDSSCVCSTRQILTETDIRVNPAIMLSAHGRDTAVRYGQSLLNEKKKRRRTLMESTASLSEGVTYVGDKMVNILYREGQHVHSILVVADGSNE